MPRRIRRTRKKRSGMKGGKCVYGVNAPNNLRNENLHELTNLSCPRNDPGVAPCCDGRELNENTRTEGLENWRANRGRFCHFNKKIVQSHWNDQCAQWRANRNNTNRARFENKHNACGTWREGGKFIKKMRSENKAYHDKEKEAKAFCRQGGFQAAADAYAAAETMRNEWVDEYFRESLLAACKTCDSDCNNHEYAAKTCASLSGDNRAVAVRANNPGLGAFGVKTARRSQGAEAEEDAQKRQRRRELKQVKEAEEKKAAEKAAAKAHERVAEESARRKAEQGAAAAAAAAEITKAAQQEYKKQAREYLRPIKLKARKKKRTAERTAAAGAATEAAKRDVILLDEAWKLAAEKGEEGVNPQNIQLLVEAYPLMPRGAAVAMLRATNGDLISAMQVLGDGGGDQGGGAGGYKKRRRTRKKRRRRRKTRRRRQRKSRRRTRRR